MGVASKVKTIKTVAAGSLVLLVAFSLLAAPKAHATYNSALLITDDVFFNTGSMNAGDIYNFLVQEGSGLANYSDVENCSTIQQPYSGTYYPHCGQSEPAYIIISDASRAYGINPQVILATMQKEQSIITTPNPTASQLNYAMGMGCPDSGGCSVTGFFNQVDNGTWQLKTDMELGNGNNWWGYTPASYPCQGSPNHSWAWTDSQGTHHYYYSYPLIKGNNITFWDDYGNGYANFTLPNMSTSTLYCYTPHVYPGSSQEYYSGSYNFVTSFEKWFGSTTTTIPLQWQYVSQQTYSDPGMTQPLKSSLTQVPTTTPGSKIYVKVQAKNTGYQTWLQNVVLGTANPNNRTSTFCDLSTWLNCERPAHISESSVEPYQIGTFSFAMDAPTTPGTYKEYFNPLIEGVTWFNNPGMFFVINVVQTATANASAKTTLNAGDYLTPGQYLMSGDDESVLMLQNDGNLVLYEDFVPVWATMTVGSGANKLIMQNDGNLVLDNGSRAVWSLCSVTGCPSSLVSNSHVTLQTDGNLAVYHPDNSVPWATMTVHNPDRLSYVDPFMPEGILLPGQQLQTADRRYRAVLQTDGNFVLYAPSGPIWATHTEGQDVSYLRMQHDGNLVLYDPSGRPLWHTFTYWAGPSYLAVQPDGNLVLYKLSGQAVWSSQTAGRQ